MIYKYIYQFFSCYLNYSLFYSCYLVFNQKKGFYIYFIIPSLNKGKQYQPVLFSLIIPFYSILIRFALRFFLLPLNASSLFEDLRFSVRRLLSSSRSTKSGLQSMLQTLSISRRILNLELIVEHLIFCIGQLIL